MSLEQTWFPVALSGELTRSPRAARLLGRRLVLFRDEHGKVAALEDRCPHRGVSLSRGAVKEGTLACAYHGWRFDPGGRCVGVPSACAGDKIPTARVPSYEVTETQDVIWARLEKGTEETPPAWARWGEPGYDFSNFQLEIACPAVWVIQNFVDCAHTGILHRGLFRGEPSKEIRARVERHAGGVRIENFGETNPETLVPRLLARGSGAIRHTDEYRAPHTVEVNYWWGDRHLVTTSVCTPEDEYTTRIFTRIGIRFGLLNRPLLAAMGPLSRRILEQDRAILEDQGRQLRLYPDRPLASTTADLPCLWVAEAHENAEGGKTTEEKTREVSYRL